MSASQYIAVIARKHDLPLQLVTAIVQVESSGDRFAWNPEPRYHYLWDVKLKRPFRKITQAEIASELAPIEFRSLAGDADAEWWGQQASWGYMQVMGAVAREHGFTGHFPGLCDPLAGLNFGCLHLVALRKRFMAKHGPHGVVAAYNAGSPRYVSGRFVNQGYVDKVDKADGFLGFS